MQIECKKFTHVNIGSFCGFADIYIHDFKLEIIGCTLYKKEDKRWLNLPVRAYKGENGEERYSHIVRFSDPKDFKDFCALSKDAIDRFVESVEENDKG